MTEQTETAIAPAPVAENANTRSRDLQPLARLLPFLRPYLGTIVLALVALLVAAAATLSLPIAVRLMIDQGFSGAQAASIDQHFLTLFAVVVVIAIFSSVRFYLVSWLGERVVADIRTAVYRHVINMSPTFFEVTRTGEILSRLTTDTTLVQSIVGSGLSIALRNAITLFGGLVMLAITSLWLTGLLVAFIPLVVLPLVVLGRRVRRLSRASQDRVADASAVAGETLNAIQTVQAFTLESLQAERFADSVAKSFHTAVQRIRIRALVTALAILVIFGAIVVGLWTGSQMVIDGSMSGGELGQFLLYAIFVAAAAASLSEVWGEVQRAAGAMERLMELLHAKATIVAPSAPVQLPVPGDGRIEIQDVSFHYPARPEVAALSGFSLQVAPGETVALVGPSGAGKSTVLQLLLRFYDPTAGRILIDSVDVRDTTPGGLRAGIGIVPQETVIFGESALENIRYGRPDADDAAVQAAARAAAANEFIEALPQSYQTFLGERGALLSGGQRQRIAIARAILKDPPIMLLDEATSSLDAESERAVQGALELLMQGRTTVIIAHRLATVLKADRIVVMDQGQVVASGTHETLLRQGGLYARLAELQFQADAA